MVGVNEVTGRNHYLEAFAAIEDNLQRSGPDWLHRIRREALDCFGATGFPTTRDEDWRYTNLKDLASRRFELAPAARNGLDKETVLARTLAAREALRMVFVNGRYRADLSLPAQEGKSETIGMSLKSALTEHPELVKEHLAQYANSDHSPLTALNTAFIEDGGFIYVPRGAAVGKPIHLVFLSSPGGRASFSHPRVLVVAGEHAQVAVVEDYCGFDAGNYFTNAVSEIVVGDGASVDHYRIEREESSAFHIASVQVRQGRNSSFSSYSICLGGGLVRSDVNSLLDSEGSDCALWGLYLANGVEHVDNHTTIDHAAPNCTSRELFHGVLAGRATGVFNGKVLVRPEAQKTNARQANRNLLLSEEALINTKPQLEIFADDVKCTHAATVGRLDENAVFYLRSRGIRKETAFQLLVRAFANDVVKGIKIEPFRSRLTDLLSSVLARNTWLEGVIR